MWRPLLRGSRPTKLHPYRSRLSTPLSRLESSHPLARYHPEDDAPALATETPTVTGESAIISGGPSPQEVAMPRTARNAPATQSPDRNSVWSKNQNPRANAMRGPRFEQTNMDYQPQPLSSAIELIGNEPIRLVETRIAACDGGGGPLGHPKVFINLDKPGPKACGYCGLRFEREVHGH